MSLRDNFLNDPTHISRIYFHFEETLLQGKYEFDPNKQKNQDGVHIM